MTQINIYRKIAVLLLLVIAGTGISHAQVTIGSGIPPAKAALLELKTEETAKPSSTTDVTNVTSTKGGLGLPRVQLVNKKTLEPFISLDDNDWINATTSKIKEKHVGLTVYNIHVSQNSDPNKEFVQGIYIWNGLEWELPAGGEQIASPCFYIPSFNIKLGKVDGSELTCDLYGEYKKQFTRAGNDTFISNNTSLANIPSAGTSKLYEANELDYVITYYDKSVIEITGLTDDGRMLYKVKSQDTTADSFLNVVFVVKE